MAAHIGEILIGQGHLSEEDLQEALDWQVLYGGRLGTNLLELKLVEEQHLAQALGKQLGAEVAWGSLEVDPALVGLIPNPVADRHEMVPWKVEKRRLKVLCTEIKIAELDQLSFKTGRNCVPVIAPEFRVFQLLRAHYGAQRQMRALDFGVVPEEGRQQRRRKKEQEQGKPVEPAPELIDEAAFNDIYAQVLQGRSAAAGAQQVAPAQVPAAHATSAPAAAPPTATPPPAAPPPAQRVAPAAPPPPAIAPGYTTPPSTPMPAASWHSQARAAGVPPVLSPSAPAADAVEQLEALPEDAILGAIEETPLRAVDWEEAPVPPPPAREETPLEFKAALKALEGVTDRDSIAHIVLRASRAKAARALLLQVQGGVAIGWDGLGEGLDGGAARTVAVPLATDSAFSLVVKTRSHYMGPLQKTPLNIRFLAMLGKKVPLSSLIFPILYRGRVSHMLYLDNGHRQQAPTDVGEMLILNQSISRTVEALVERKRKAAAGR